MSGTQEELEAGRFAMDLVESVYRCTQEFAKQEWYGLTNQIRRAAVSVPSKIAEGKGLSSERELMQFLDHARGSLYEFQTQVKIARRLNYLNIDAASALDSQTEQAGRLLNGLIRKFRTPPATSESKA